MQELSMPKLRSIHVKYAIGMAVYARKQPGEHYLCVIYDWQHYGDGEDLWRRNTMHRNYKGPWYSVIKNDGTIDNIPQSNRTRLKRKRNNK